MYEIKIIIISKIHGGCARVAALRKSFCTAYFFVYNVPIELIVSRNKGADHDPAHI